MYWVSLCGTTSFTLYINDTKPTFFCLSRVCEHDDDKVIFINRFIHLYIFRINKIYVSLCETITFILYK